MSALASIYAAARDAAAHDVPPYHHDGADWVVIGGALPMIMPLVLDGLRLAPESVQAVCRRDALRDGYPRDCGYAAVLLPYPSEDSGQ